MNQNVPENCPMITPPELGKTLIKVAAIVAAMAVISGAVTWAADTRYATKEEVKTATETVLTKLDYNTDQARKTALDDKIYELQQIPDAARTQQQRAQLDRYVRQFAELNARWTTPPPGVRQH